MGYKLHQTPNKAFFQYRVDADVVAIEDKMGEIPVTVDALNVYKYIEQELGTLEGKKVIWRDQMGEWDGMEMENGKLYFFPIGSNSYQEAVRKIIQIEKTYRPE